MRFQLVCFWQSYNLLQKMEFKTKHNKGQKMKMKKTSLIIATVFAANSMAFAESATSTLKSGSTAKSATEALKEASMNTQLIDIVASATDTKAAELIATRDQLFQIIGTMNAIKNDNEKDTFLKYANSIQAGLALATTATLGAHIGATEKRKFMLTISAATALISSATRIYKDRSSLDTKDVSAVLSDFNAELMKNKKALTPEMRDLVKEVSKMSNDVLNSKGAIEKIVGNASDASYITTIIIVGMAVAHWVSPKLAAEAEASLKTVSATVGTAVKGVSKFAEESKLTVGTAGAGSVLPDVIGNVMGLNTENSQKLISETVNNLTAATLNFQAQIDAVTKAVK